ncbi:TPA: glycosyltransferase family 2 protein [Citrobacter freundii]
MDVKLGVSVVMIIRNEAQTISRALDSIHGKVDEIIIVDSGSEDETLAIARNHTACPKIHYKKWDDNFSDLRNYAISLCSYTYCLMMDGDEYIDQNSQSLLRQNIMNALDNVNNCIYAPLIDNLDGTRIVNNPRIFRIRNSLSYKGRVHEYLNEGSGCSVRFLHDIKINHTGYDLETYSIKNKKERNLKLVRMQISEDAENLRWYYFLLRYIDSNSPEAFEILNKFAELPLPYPINIEVYAFNLKTKFILHMMATGEVDIAFAHARELYSYYHDRSTSVLFMVTSLVHSLDCFESNFFKFIENMKTTSQITEDEMLEIKTPDNYMENCIMYILARLDLIKSKNEQ